MNVSMRQIAHVMMSLSFNENSDEAKEWVSLSFRVCKGDAHLMHDVQRLGKLDTIIRIMEREAAENLQLERADSYLLADDVQSTLSFTWLICGYEILRLLRERGAFSPENPALALLAQFELIRMPLVKGAVAKTGRRNSAGVSHRATPLINVDTGAAVWAVKSKDDAWHEISRQDLSNALLAINVDNADAA